MKSWSLSIVTSLFAAFMLHGAKATAQLPPTASPQSGCLSGYPDGTFRGDRAMTRYEFAAGLDACLRQIDQSIRLNLEGAATRSDFDRLIQRQRELNDQLRGLGDRVDNLSGESSSK